MTSMRWGEVLLVMAMVDVPRAGEMDRVVSESDMKPEGLTPK